MSKRIDYALKSKVLNEHQDMLLRIKQASKRDYALERLNETGEVSPILTNKDVLPMTSLELSRFYLKYFPVEFPEAQKIIHASYVRVARLRKRIASMLNKGQCIFLTLTFTDETLAKTSPETRRRYVSRYLKNYDCQYVANIDFGKENGREHYHAVINCSKVIYQDWCYGAVKGLKIRNNNKDDLRLAKYVSKLANHAIKETTKRNALIYSR